MNSITISEKLPQFTNTGALLIVCGTQDAIIYFAKDGQVEQLEFIEIEKTKYSDNEGFFSSFGRNMVSGASREIDKNDTNKKLVKELESELKNIFQSRKIDEVYIFAPSHIDIVPSLALANTKLIKKQLKGNYVKKHPFDLLKKIK